MSLIGSKEKAVAVFAESGREDWIPVGEQPTHLTLWVSCGRMSLVIDHDYASLQKVCLAIFPPADITAKS